MYLLKKICTIILLLSLFFLNTCKPQGPLTPSDAFTQLRDAYKNRDSQLLESLLSKDSKVKIERMIALVKKMDDKQLKSLSGKFGVSVERLKNLTARDYMALQILIGEKIKEDILKEITGYKIIEKKVKGEKAVLKVENGMELQFVKEGPYWKLDLSDY